MPDHNLICGRANGERLRVVPAKAFGNKKTNLTFVVPCTNSDAALQVTETDEFCTNTRNCALNTRNVVFKIMNFAGARQAAVAGSPRDRPKHRPKLLP